MDQLHQQVARARRRLVLEQFLGRLVWCLLAAFTVAAIAVAVPRVLVVDNLPVNWDNAWLLGALVTGVLSAGVWTLVRSRSPLDAAIEIDRRFELRERDCQQPVALARSTNERSGSGRRERRCCAVNRIKVDDKFRVKLDRRACWPLVPAAIAFVARAFVDNRQAASSVDPVAAAKTEKQSRSAVESLRKKMEEQRSQTEKDKGA